MTTYLDLTNRLLRRINEAEINEPDWDAARGIHAVAKDAILDTIRKINNKKAGWIYVAVEHTQTLTVGQEEYPWPVGWANVDWNSFQIQKDDNLNQEPYHLTYINRDKWYSELRDLDYNSGTDGRDLPYYVFPAHGQGWGVSPSPNQEYTIKYRYFKNPDTLSLPTDIVVIPERFDYVIISGGLYHLSLFRDNPENTALTKQEFDENLGDMIRQQIMWPKRMDDTRLGG
jgi:hypothetical protein